MKRVISKEEIRRVGKVLSEASQHFAYTYQCSETGDMIVRVHHIHHSNYYNRYSEHEVRFTHAGKLFVGGKDQNKIKGWLHQKISEVLCEDASFLR